jgi:NAD(P)-dependent dehydrogenase (short-subunit alcohol dehydrogenase family)
MNMFSQLAFWKTYFTPDRYSIAQIPDLTGKVAIVTGANTGLGYATTVALAGRGAHVFLACRSQKRALAAIDSAILEIRSKYPLLSGAPKLEFLELDLMDLNKTKKAAKEFLQKGLPLHILVNNAGIQVLVPSELSPDGIESKFAVNHLRYVLFLLCFSGYIGGGTGK